MSELHFETITELEQARYYWDMFTPEQTIFDTWEFRYCFYKYDKFPLNFIVGFDAEKPVGLLSLQQNSETGKLEFFGGSWMEDTKAFILPEYLYKTKDFYAQIKSPALLGGIRADGNFTRALALEDYEYELDLSKYKNYWDYINDRFNSKHVKNWKREIARIEELPVKVTYNDPKDLELLIQFNIKSFGADSSFNDHNRRKIYRDFLDLGFETYLKTIAVDGVKQSVSLNLVYKGCSFFLNAGTNSEAVPNLGKYSLLIDIGNAIESKCTRLDALMYSYNWKERWHFDKVPFYKFEYPAQTGQDMSAAEVRTAIYTG